MDYAHFLASKQRPVVAYGRPSSAVGINDLLFPFQRSLVQWAIRKGRAALFCDTGLGKTFMQLEWARLIGVRTLILAPLAVAQQTIAEGRKLGVEVTYARAQTEASEGITITNYEMLKYFDLAEFSAVVLDESSILKSFDGKTRTRLIEAGQNTLFRLCCTATPAPNDLEEFGNHAEFLGIGTRRDMLATFFVHKDDGWHIKGHAVEPFYQWLASWSMMVKWPSDIGFADDGYILPALTINPIWTVADTVAAAHQNGRLFLHGLQGITGRSVARKATVTNKVAEAARLIASKDGQWLIWCGLNEEGRLLAQAIPGAVNVEGADAQDTKTAAFGAFLNGSTKVLITKPKIGGFGLNLQHVHQMIFVGMSDSYEQYYQAIRRCWRFGQQEPVQVYTILSEMEAPVLENVLRKEQLAQGASQQMVKSMAAYERDELAGVVPVNSYHREETKGPSWRMMLGDCVDRLREVADASVDFSVFSPPFLSLYSYTASERDMGNSQGEQEFFTHYGYFLAEMHRVMKLGRIVACHVAQVPSTLVDDGVIGLKDFRGKVIEAFLSAGFIHHGEVCIDKDPQAQAIRTHSKALLFAQLRKDASWLRPAIADYILLFRAPGENQVPIHPDLTNDDWIQWARPIWYGIRESDTLNVAEARTEKDEKHIAPLQLETIERCIRLWSNLGELVLSPFAGIGSEGYQAVKLGRRFVGIELKLEYYHVALRNLGRAELSKTQQTLPLPIGGAT